MSLSHQTENPNPATRYMEWKGGEGKLKWYDKSEGVDKFIKLPFRFLMLDKLVTIKGFSDEEQGGIWSNEVRDTRTDILTVRTKRGIKAQGLYNDVKHVNGARFCQSIYCAYKNDEGDLVIGNLQLHGVANSAFIEFCKQNKVYGKTITITGSIDGKKGATKFKIPVFEIGDASEETVAEAIALDRQLQEYLNVYLDREPETVEEEYPDYSEDGYTGVNLDAEPPEETGSPDDDINW